jgi:hypothetical protein
MKRVVTAAMTTAAVVLAAGVAHANPAPPQSGSPCFRTEDGGALNGAQTYSPQGEVLICLGNYESSQWQPLDGLQRPVETWFTYGPAQTLSAADILPAVAWVSASGRAADVCTAVQTPSDGGSPVTHTNDTGYYRDFLLIPDLAALTLSGNCNWRKAWERAPG